MLTASSAFHSAVDANTTEVDCKVEIEREFNAIADNIDVTAGHGPVDPRFHKDNVVNIRNPQRNGIAYGPMSEFFPSDNPLHGFRLIDSADFDADRDAAYYIPVKFDHPYTANVRVNYQQNFKMNCIEVRYENSRTSTTYYDETVEIYTATDGGADVLVHSSTMNTDGVTRIYYNGSSWSTSKTGMDATGVDVGSVRVRFMPGTYDHQPRIMYIGGLHVLDVSDDIIDASVTKTEFEQSAYLPVGEPSGNTFDLTLDNTAMNYRFGPNIDRNFFLKNQRVRIEFGVNTKYGGGADSFEYVPGGTFYIDDFGYDEKEMTVNVSGQDFSKVLQETFCGNYLWQDKSLKYIVRDVLARSGITPNGVVFDFGVTGNADETAVREYIWSHDEQTVWDFLRELAKSELGTVFYDEEENLVFTDRLDMDNKYAAGIQRTYDPSINLESMDEAFEVGANKIKVNYEKLAANSTKVNLQLVRDGEGEPKYEQGPEVALNQVLWQPEGDEGYLGSATLSRTLRPSDQYIYISGDTALQITREEGEVLIGDEFITYSGSKVMSGPSKELRLTIDKRNARKTVFDGVIPTHKGWFSNYNLDGHIKWDRQLFTANQAGGLVARRKVESEGFRQYLHTYNRKAWKTITCTEFESSQVDYSSNYRIYGVRFRFNELAGSLVPDQAAGLYMNLVQDAGRGIFFEVSNPERNEVVRNDAQGNARAYKTSNWMNSVAMPPHPADNNDEFAKFFFFDEASSGVDGDDGTYIDITVIQEEQTGPDLIYWYVNGEYMGTFETEYTIASLSDLGLSWQEEEVANTPTQSGKFGFFTRGGTDATVDFIYASNDTRIGPDELLQSRGFRKYFDAHRDSWNVKKDYFFDRPYYVEFGAPVHEVVEFEVDHDTYPNLYSRILNTDEESVSVFKASHDPFSSKMLVGNTARIGIDLNNTVYYPDGTTLDHSFLVYGVGVVRSESDTITTSHAASIRRYGIEEVEMENPWVNSKEQAIDLAVHIRKFWSTPQQWFDLEVFPNPALQVRDRVNVSYPEKGIAGGAWLVNGITLTYDGGFTSTVKLKHYESYPTEDLDYREKGGIIIT